MYTSTVIDLNCKLSCSYTTAVSHLTMFCHLTTACFMLPALLLLYSLPKPAGVAGPPLQSSVAKPARGRPHQSGSPGTGCPQGWVLRELKRLGQTQTCMIYSYGCVLGPQQFSVHSHDFLKGICLNKVPSSHLTTGGLCHLLFGFEGVDPLLS